MTAVLTTCALGPAELGVDVGQQASDAPQAQMARAVQLERLEDLVPARRPVVRPTGTTTSTALTSSDAPQAQAETTEDAVEPVTVVTAAEPSPAPATDPALTMPAATPVPVVSATPAPAVSATPEPVPPPAQAMAEPTRVVIPRIGVSHPMTPVGLHADRSLVVPDDAHVAGWYTGAPRPGQVGPAIVAGHNWWKGSTGVFWRLHELGPGDVIEIHHDTGGVVRFTVDRLEQHPKDAFPTQRVYGNTTGPELRVITCGGVFDQRERSHVDNVIVFATRTG